MQRRGHNGNGANFIGGGPADRQSCRGSWFVDSLDQGADRLYRRNLYHYGIQSGVPGSRTANGPGLAILSLPVVKLRAHLENAWTRLDVR